MKPTIRVVLSDVNKVIVKMFLGRRCSQSSFKSVGGRRCSGVRDCRGGKRDRRLVFATSSVPSPAGTKADTASSSPWSRECVGILRRARVMCSGDPQKWARRHSGRRAPEAGRRRIRCLGRRDGIIRPGGPHRRIPRGSRRRCLFLTRRRTPKWIARCISWEPSQGRVRYPARCRPHPRRGRW